MQQRTGTQMVVLDYLEYFVFNFCF